ncbi:MAG: beta-lactamase family protein [Caldilineaceae bacterium]|nr:beta-lactamase family protein [Caldilineaceae bacterium]
MNATIDALIQSEMEKQHIPGLSLAIARRGKVTMAKGYGLANLEWGIPATRHTVYQLASVTKQFTATAIMLLVQAGQVELDATLDRYLENTPAAWQAVTIRQLLAHTSGMLRDGTPSYWTKPADMKQDYDYPQMFQMIAQHPLDFAPGTKSSYSNSGYFLLGLVIEQLTQQSLNAFFSERIFTPLGMTATRINELRTVIRHRATGYQWNDTGWHHPDYIGLTHHFANGGLISTVMDLAKWDAALYDETILPQALLHQMWTPVTLNDGTPTDYGFGWGVSSYEGHRLVAHSGALPGFTSHIARFLDDQLTVIILTNSASATPGTLAKSVASSYWNA